MLAGAHARKESVMRLRAQQLHRQPPGDVGEYLHNLRFWSNMSDSM